MDILKEIEENRDYLLPEDLEFYQVELRTGNYEKAYIAQCESLISEIRNWNVQDVQEEKNEDRITQKKSSLLVDLKELSPDVSEDLIQSQELSFDMKLKMIRKGKQYKTLFKDFITEQNVDENFIKENFSIFKQWELSYFLTIFDFDEEYLETHFDLLEHQYIAKHQQISESFFMKHFIDLDTKTVLNNKKNTWIKNPSRKLTTFLRLKGVKL